MTIDVADIKTQFKSIMDSANTTTADYDLSTNLNTRVQKVLKLNPSRINPQASFFPYVTIFTDRKRVELTSMAINQQKANRTGDISFTVIGAVWEQLVSSDLEDEADEMCEILMENVEEVLRRNFKLNNTVRRSLPTDIDYHALPIDEQTNMRVGVMTLNCLVDY